MIAKEIKAETRKSMLSRRDGLSPEDKTALDTALCQKLFEAVHARNVKVVHSYIPFGSEPDIKPVLRRLLDMGIAVICPKTLPKKQLENLVLKSLDELEEGRFGTLHPANSTAYHGEIDLFIVPGVAFDVRNYRLGYGSGYYDVFFSSHPGGYKLGICYPFQVLDNLPAEPHDVPLDAILY